MLRSFEPQWRDIGLFFTIRVVRSGLLQDPQNFYGVMELYNPDTRTFFTPVGELGISYHEMRYVSGLDYGEFVYEERVPPPFDLEKLSARYGQEFADLLGNTLSFSDLRRY